MINDALNTQKGTESNLPLILRLLNEPVFFLITLHPGSSLIVSYKPVIKLFYNIPFPLYCNIILSLHPLCRQGNPIWSSMFKPKR